MKNITNHRHFALAVVMAAVLALAGFGTVAEAETTVIENEPIPKTDTIGYTFTDMNATMYTKNSVDVRSLPSADGTILGSLAKNQVVTVTGKCNETDWYRIAYNNGEAYVSNQYLSDIQTNVSSDVAVVTDINTNTTHSVSSDVIANMNANAKVAHMNLQQQVFLSLFLDTNNAIVADNGTIVDSNNQVIAYINDDGVIFSVGPDDYCKDMEWLWSLPPGISYPAKLNRDSAEEIWGYLNEERTQAGLNPIAWDEDIYKFACQRAQALVTDFSHNGCEPYGENIAYCPNSAYLMHMSWYFSPFGHHENYMNPNYTRGACAVYEYNGYIYGVENFTY